jgi:hypothetical protein
VEDKVRLVLDPASQLECGVGERRNPREAATKAERGPRRLLDTSVVDCCASTIRRCRADEICGKREGARRSNS